MFAPAVGTLLTWPGTRHNLPGINFQQRTPRAWKCESMSTGFVPVPIHTEWLQMRRVSFRFSLPCAVAACLMGCLLIGSAVATPMTYEEVTVGNPGNANDIPRFDGSDAVFGAVATSYQIGKYDVTIGQYTAFLNAVAATDTYSLYNASMGSNFNVAGISQSGTSGSYRYSVIGPSGTAYGQSGANRPITYVSWFDAARFANWMTNGQGSGSTETGAYTLVGGQTIGNAVAATPGAAFSIPTENQWYKAAFYNPTLNSGTGGYYAYATQSDSAPGNIIGSGANQANYRPDFVYTVTQSDTIDLNQNYLTDVGAFSGSGSFYGTFDQSGNVFQWNDLDGTPGSYRGLRGSGWSNDLPYRLSSSGRNEYIPELEFDAVGFRLVSPVASSVPEIDPNSFGSVLALVLGSLGLLERRRAR